MFYLLNQYNIGMYIPAGIHCDPKVFYSIGCIKKLTCFALVVKMNLQNCIYDLDTDNTNTSTCKERECECTIRQC